MGRVLLLVLLVACAEQREPATCTTDCASNGVHPRDWIANHGADLARRGWDFALCQGCHGADFAGKGTAPSCLTCHQKGPTACDTCHATPPATGAHATHVAQGVACSECHVVPATWDEPGHLLDAAGNPIGGAARVTFGALANRDVTPPRRTAPAAWDHDAGTCTNVYCHGGILGDAAATHAQPAWNGGAAQVACGGCHGAPPANHAQSECTVCHPGSGHGTARHIDGVIDVGNGTGTCTGCHGQGSSAAPPRGLHGETESTSLAVGAHTAHLLAGRLRGPIACSECHVVPTAVGDAGHLDTTLPAELVFGALATSDGAQPAWDRTSATCTTVYCHGGGAKLSTDAWADKLSAQSWTTTTGATVYCGACHGLPPVDGVHVPTQTLTDCATCHPGTVGPFGNILVANGKHINGAVDLD
jgi:predicted CxxxxCH...CXXCH cytochrome family protein